MAGRLLRLTLSLLGLAALVTGTASWWVTAQWDRPVAGADAPAQVVEIAPGTPFRVVAHDLARLGIVASAPALEWLGRWNGTAGRIQPGEYRLSPAMSPRQLLATLVAGEVILHPVTLPEGITVRETVARLVGAGFDIPPEYREHLEDPEVIARAGVPTGGGIKVPFEGYLFPDTYLFPRDTGPEQVIGAMLRRLDAAFTPARKQRMAALGWSRHQVLTLASLIEKETALPEERARISAVFHNRLKRGMRLQTDPTVIYATPHFDGDIKGKDLRRDDPYNTYRHKGLPPGPIAAPGEAAIDAALNPAEDSALYFVARGDGGHVFSDNVADHNRAVRRHQR